MTGVSIQRARTIDSIYEEVKERDIALSTEGPLTLALDRRIERPRLGRLAATPRSQASGQMIPQDQRPLFFALVERTSLSWKEAAFAIQHILDCWDRTGDPEAVLQSQYDTPAMRTALNVVRCEKSSYRDLWNHDSVDGDVAVIGEELFTPLDRRIIPSSYDRVDLFTEGTFQLPEFRIFESPTDVVETLVAHITPQNADDVGIVVDRSGRYASLIESALAANDIPYQGGPGFEDQQAVRVLVRLLRAAFDSHDIRLENLRSPLVKLGIDPPTVDDNKRIRDVEHEGVRRVVEFIDRIPRRSFRELLESFRELSDAPLWEFEAELDRLGLSDAVVTQARLDDLEFYLDSFDIPFESTSEGVLLAAATSSVFVDRSTIFYVALDRGWERAVPDRPWVDENREDRRNLKRFQLLLQNGQNRHYFVVNSQGGDPVTPCLYFEDLLEESFDTFADFSSTRHGAPTSTGPAPFSHRSQQAVSTDDPVESISQSTLNTLVNSPRDYYMGALLEGPTTHYLQRGNSFHDVAELYAEHPEVVTANREDVVQWIVDRQRPFLDQHDVATWRTTVENGVDLLTAYLDDVDIRENTYDRYESLASPNELAEHLGVSVDSSITEQWFANDTIGAHGVVDLLQDPSTIVDHKTGKQSTAASVIRDGDPSGPSDTPNFQAYHYLAHHRDTVPGEPISFRLVHILDQIDQAIVAPSTVSIRDSVTEIEYRPESFSEYVTEREIYRWLWEDLSEKNNRRRVLETMGYARYEEFFTEHRYPAADSKEDVLDTPISENFEEYCVEHVGDWKYSRRGARSTIKKLFSLREGRLFDDDLDAYEEFLETWIDRLNRYRTARFPVGDDPNENRLDYPLLIVGDEDQ